MSAYTVRHLTLVLGATIVTPSGDEKLRVPQAAATRPGDGAAAPRRPYAARATPPSPRRASSRARRRGYPGDRRAPGPRGRSRHAPRAAAPEVSEHFRRPGFLVVPLRWGLSAEMKDVPGFLQQSQSSGPGQAAVWHRLEELYTKK